MDRRVEVRVSGVVQGVGFRPFVVHQATGLGLVGHVGNDSAGVFVDAQGASEAIAVLLDALAIGPRMARVESVQVRDLPLGAAVSFEIAASLEGVGSTSLPPDTAVCESCLAEMRDPADRRHGYPFITCTDCGPRYTIVERLPYDRSGTTMIDFPLCPACAGEYEDPRSRRFHAQPTACPECGPQLSASVSDVATALADGRIVAIKGIGGYHLACDASNKEAVARLRERKARGDKPFALMVPTLDAAREVIEVDDQTAAILTSAERPIVLAPARDLDLQASVAPGNGYLGVMLPYAPVHHLLFDAGAPGTLVMTSGNRADEPICITEVEAQERLADIADMLVHHDRRIHISCDDSVVRHSTDGLLPVRRSRGYAPLPVPLSVDAAPMLAVGGELKTTIAVARGRHAWLSQHIGDTGNLETIELLDRTARILSEVQRVEPTAIVSDLHPGYLSRRWAADEAARTGVPHLLVQHHHAHLASLLAEHQWPAQETIIGFAFDGTGYGTDGTIWGGEVMIASLGHAERVGHLRSILLPGGDAAIRRPLRTALAHLAAAGLDAPPALELAAEPAELAVVGRMLATGTGCTPTTSVGRLFDAVASLLGLRHTVDYEGQAAIELEALAAVVDSGGEGWDFTTEDGPDGLVLDPGPALMTGMAAVSAGQSPGTASRAFHEGLADAVAQAAVLLRERTGLGVVGLSGGVFANTLLTGLIQGRLEGHGFTVLLHRLVPPNDGGLALGQVAVAAAGGATERSR